ncbi:hypothetical protein CONCODRAFT_68392 [Conidiobolus coronatus NRRL 28638]|uniref:Uncharacterized protein n=1 Tax=Conidiobolus coronatus (strain ATCC 28846 / CBS 209.66 / NRRL 28638) TaxID=796925 RepID=A0A137PE41_CONC2|nr:hypothetical protein CONCODRAFT_68392 [Conidiobolus coronatus NRRL 28638]|eukprot:KXN73273.1 hypothetical protein CONCODRAFT_68392 [Conidiobolus coronatus NRRL 28638]
MTSTQLALIYTFVASILASNIPIMDAGNNRVGVNEAFGRFANLDSAHRFGTGWPGLNDRSALTRRQNTNEHITITETDTETIRKVDEVPERVIVEDRHPEVVVVEDMPTGVLSEEFELRLEEELLLADEFDLAARRNRGGHVLGEDVILPIEPIRHLHGEEDNVIINHHNTVNNFTPNGIAITGVGPNGSGLGNGAKGPITISNLSVN